MYDLVIVGGGPAGLSAGIYAMRAAMHAVLVEKGMPGGQIALTKDVENYPGIEEVGGFELCEKFLNHAKRYNLEIRENEVARVEPGVDFHEVVLTDGTRLDTHAVILAAGGSARKLGVPGEMEQYGKGVSYCATCDGFFFRGKKVVVVGGGNSALDEGLFLTRYVDELVIVHRRDSLRADPILQERAFANPKVRFIWDSTVEAILGEEKVTGVRITNLKTGEGHEMPTDGVFPYIGHVPNSWLFTGLLDLDEGGYILTDGRTRTKIPGIFAAGDVVDHIYRQAITAAGEGCMAAMEATWFLAEQEFAEKKRAEAVAA